MAEALPVAAKEAKWVLEVNPEWVSAPYEVTFMSFTKNAFIPLDPSGETCFVYHADPHPLRFNNVA